MQQNFSTSFLFFFVAIPSAIEKQENVHRTQEGAVLVLSTILWIASVKKCSQRDKFMVRVRGEKEREGKLRQQKHIVLTSTESYCNEWIYVLRREYFGSSIFFTRFHKNLLDRRAFKFKCAVIVAERLLLIHAFHLRLPVLILITFFFLQLSIHKYKLSWDEVYGGREILNCAPSLEFPSFLYYHHRHILKYFLGTIVRVEASPLYFLNLKISFSVFHCNYCCCCVHISVYDVFRCCDFAR